MSSKSSAETQNPKGDQKTDKKNTSNPEVNAEENATEYVSTGFMLAGLVLFGLFLICGSAQGEFGQKELGCNFQSLLFLGTIIGLVYMVFKAGPNIDKYIEDSKNS